MQNTLDGRKCTVLGLGISNLPLIDFLLDRGAVVCARDQKDIDFSDDSIIRFKNRGVQFVGGNDYLENIDADIIFRSPGIRPDLPQIRAAVEKGAVLSSEMELFFDLCPSEIFAVTGSDGKTTTTTLIYKLLEMQCKKEGNGRKVFVGGNIGTPLLPRLSEMGKDDFAVVELSSFQLMTMQKSAFAAAITNLSPNHLNWHTDMDEYTQAKLNVYRHGAKRVVLNADNAVTSSLLGTTNANEIAFSSTKSIDEMYGEIRIYDNNGFITVNETPVLSCADIKIPGRHNVENYMCAIGMTLGFVDNDIISELARTFGGVEHRIEFVRNVDGVKYYNSSIDSSPSRTIAALRSFNEKPIIICGGRDKHVPFDTLAAEILTRAKALVLTGEAKGQIFDAIKNCEKYRENEFHIVVTNDFADAVNAARNLAKSGDTVLLSPACTSFDAFKNFEERGRKFKDIVNAF